MAKTKEQIKKEMREVNKMMNINIYELIIKTLNKTNITIAEGYMLARKLEHICEEWNTISIKVNDEGFRIETYFKVDNCDIYYEEEHIISIFTDGVVCDYKHYKEEKNSDWTIEKDAQGTILEFLQNQLKDHSNK